MIIDVINIAGNTSYLKEAAGNLNLAASVPSVAQTPVLEKGQQMNVSGIQFYLEATDLLPLFPILEDDGTGNLVKRTTPLISVTIQKEILPGLFADPYRSRIHSIGGFQDFKKGVFQNCDVFRVNKKPTLVSLGTDVCTWESARHHLPKPANFESAYWEIPFSKAIPSSAFNYSIELSCYDNGNNLINNLPFVLAANLDPTVTRTKNLLNIQNVKSYSLKFVADVKHDSTIVESIITEKEDTIGRPLLEGIYLLEAVDSKYDFYSLQEFLALCSEYDLLQAQGLPLKKMMATLQVAAKLVRGPNQTATSGNNEYLKVEIRSNKLKMVNAQLVATEMVKPN